ncbi:MAG: hypothetical protein HBSAPP03_20240 [Phycisphaerae bacterium]|nr:MAG: hypothetical protein HBSAPP03_20240 [Phycisphaerae bacterium]
MNIRSWVAVVFALFAPVACAQTPPATTEPPAAGSFRVTFDAAIQPTPYTGRVYVALSTHGQPPLRRRAFDWYQPLQVFAVDVTDLPPGGSITIGENALAYPKPLAQAAQGALYVQAFARRNLDSPEPGQGVGDLFSDVIRVTFRQPEPGVADLVLNQEVKSAGFPTSDRVREFTLPSPALTEFLGRPFSLRAGVILPKDFNPIATYPVLYFIGGFGSDHTFARQLRTILQNQPLADNLVIVVPDASCYRGHSVFADSANNGPWGRAFTTELVPAIDAAFHGNGHRYLTGISSGGWSSLWLQVTYHDTFHGVWSHCPDPVDFSDFQQINLYAAGVNMYKDHGGERRPLARSAGRNTLFYDDFMRMETVMGPGGQIHSFEAVFSPRLPNGQPRPLFDRATGNVDPLTAKAWEAYDINLILMRRWGELGPKLKGKLHIVAGGYDTYFLDGAVRNLKATLEGLRADADVQIIPDMIHSIHGPTMNAMFETIAKENPRAGAPRGE